MDLSTVAKKGMTPHSLQQEPHHWKQFSIIPRPSFFLTGVGLCYYSSAGEIVYSKPCQQGFRYLVDYNNSHTFWYKLWDSTPDFISELPPLAFSRIPWNIKMQQHCLIKAIPSKRTARDFDWRWTSCDLDYQ